STYTTPPLPPPTPFPYTTLFRSEAARPEVVVHLAGLSSVASSHQDPARAFSVNALGAVHLLAAVRDAAPKARILLIGSAKCAPRSEEHTSELQSRGHLVCRLLLE